MEVCLLSISYIVPVFCSRSCYYAETEFYISISSYAFSVVSTGQGLSICHAVTLLFIASQVLRLKSCDSSI